MITRIEAYSYRCFPELVVDLDRYHVLAGANGAGKTTLLDIPVLIGDMLRGRGIVGAFLERQDNGRSPRASALTDLLYQGKGDAIAFAFEARLPQSVTEVLGESSHARLGHPVPTHLRYELLLEVTPRTIRVADEYLFLFTDRGDRPEPGVFPQGRSENGSALRREGWQSVIHREGGPLTRFAPESTRQPVDIPPLRVSSLQLALGTVPPDDTLFPAALWFAALLRGGVVYFDPDWEALRSPAPPGLPKRLTASGQNLPWLALDLQDSDPDEFATWIDHVRTADGTLKILALTLLSFLDDEAMPRLLVTEEPENGIHPQAIETALQSLSMLYDAQVWISTHSPIVLAQTDLRNVLATRLGKNGSVTVVSGDKHPRLRDWRGTIDIGSLFAAGVLAEAMSVRQCQDPSFLQLRDQLRTWSPAERP